MEFFCPTVKYIIYNIWYNNQHYKTHNSLICNDIVYSIIVAYIVLYIILSLNWLGHLVSYHKNLKLSNC